MSTGTERRTPKQQRSRAKVEAVLDAAGRLVVERGCDHLTTTTAAEAAGVAVGSLYQYFDSVDAIIDGLMGRCAERFADRLEAELVGIRFTRKRDAANAALDCFVRFYGDEPLLRALRDARPLGSVIGFGATGDRIMRVVIESLAGQGLADAGDEDFLLEVEVQWAVAEALVLLAFRRDPDGDPAVLAHLRRLFDLDVLPVAPA